MTDTLLIIGGGVEQVPAYERAKARGLIVVGTDGNLNAPALRLADYVLEASTRDAGETLAVVSEFNRKHPINGVMTIANDVPYTVATVANALGLPSISLEAAQCASDKLLMKTRFVEQGVACPWFQGVNSVSELETLVGQNPEKRYVLKPIDGRGARGVLQVDNKSDLAWCFEESRRWGDSGQLMVEEFVPGMQLSTESFLLDGRCYTPAISERNYEYMARFSPYIIENGGTIPAILTEAQCQAIDDLILAGAKAMGITQGIVKGDLVMTSGGKPLIIELAARLSGGWFATHQIPEASGVDLVDAVISYTLGHPVNAEDLTPNRQRATAIRYWFPSSGVITRISGEEPLKETSGLMAYGFFRKKGEVQPPICSHPDRFGYVMVSGPDRETVLSRVEQAIQSVTIEVQTGSNRVLAEKLTGGNGI